MITDLLKNCTICPRNCGKNRAAGQRGYCRAGALPKLARAALHFGEEPCISGTRGSGAVFFSHCNLRCVFCQNYPISQEGVGREVSVEDLTQVFLDLGGQGAHNINLVSPTPYLPMVVEGVASARRDGLRLPIIHNSNGYETVEAIQLLRGTVDVYLPDLKYGPGPSPGSRSDNSLVTESEVSCPSAASLRYSAAPGYFEAATAAIAAMAAQVGRAEFDDDGLIRRGVIVRHLVLPGMVEDSKRVLRWIKENLPEGVLLSLMSQYTPLYRASRHPEINRRLTIAEYGQVLDFCVDIGLIDGYAQDLSAAGEAMVPIFDLTGVSGSRAFRE